MLEKDLIKQTLYVYKGVNKLKKFYINQGMF